MNKPFHFSIVGVNRCRGRFQTRTFDQLFHPSGNRPRFLQSLTTQRHLLKFHTVNRKLFWSNIFGKIVNQNFDSFRYQNFDGLNRIESFYLWKWKKHYHQRSNAVTLYSIMSYQGGKPSKSSIYSAKCATYNSLFLINRSFINSE